MESNKAILLNFLRNRINNSREELLYLTHINSLYNNIQFQRTNLNIKLGKDLCEIIIALLTIDYKQILGLKIVNNKIFLANNCKFDNNYNNINFDEFFMFLDIHNFPYNIESEIDIKLINNNEAVVRKTNKSKFFCFNIEGIIFS